MDLESTGDDTVSVNLSEMGTQKNSKNDFKDIQNNTTSDMETSENLKFPDMVVHL